VRVEIYVEKFSEKCYHAVPLELGTGREGESMDSGEFLRFSAKLDEKRLFTPEGVEYWRARDLQTLLGYDTWQNFENVIERAKEACASAGSNPSDWFSDTTEPIISGKGGLQLRRDVFLTRFASYLTAMNGETSKPEIGMAQTYFAVQTRRQKRFDCGRGLDSQLDVPRLFRPPKGKSLKCHVLDEKGKRVRLHVAPILVRFW
jgi:hypothetical protein